MISVIVPVYKVEAYLDQCVQSLVNQTYKDLEIILVDDGSPDNCPAMCDAWAAKDSRIKVIHKKNGGLSDARNAGMAVAKGEYMAFVDSDDWVDTEMYEALLSRLEETDSDVASCGILRIWDENGDRKRIEQGTGDHVLEQIPAMQALIRGSLLVMTVWNKLYRTSLIRDISFPVGKIHEDEYWSWQAVSRVRRVATLEREFYCYRQRQGSIMAESAIKYPMNVLEAKCQRHDFLTEHMPELKNESSLNILYTCLYQGQRVKKYLSGREQRSYLKEIKRIVQTHPVDGDCLRGMSLPRRLRYWGIFYGFDMVCTVQNWLGIGI